MTERGEQTSVAVAPSTAVPFLDLKGVNNRFRGALDRAWAQVLEHGAFVGGPEVARFEAEFAAFCGANACVGVANGTDAIELILAGLGIGRGDEVILPANTFVATAEAISAVGARPRFVDVDPATLLIDPAAVRAAIGPDTAAIVAVHLFGQLADVAALYAIALGHGLALIEDAAQAHGATEHGLRVGTMGHAAAFSFYPGKNLGALGDGGAVVTDDPALAERVRTLGEHGRSRRDRSRHERIGRNSRLDTLQAALLSVKLARLAEDNRARAAAMQAYRVMLPPGCTPLAVRDGAEPVYHLAVVQVEDRSRVTNYLTQRQIGWGVHYPVPCHLQPAFLHADPLPVAERAATRILSLPMSPTIEVDQIETVCSALREVTG